MQRAMTAKLLAAAIVAAAAPLAASAGAQMQPVSPRMWWIVSEGIGLTQPAGDAYAGAMIHLPAVGGGMRFSRSHGIEITAGTLQALFGNESQLLVDPRPLPPNQMAFSGTWVVIRGGLRQPFATMGAIGSGAYRETNSGRMNVGAHAFLGTAIQHYTFATLTTELRMVGIPNSSAGRLLTLALTVGLRGVRTE